MLMLLDCYSDVRAVRACLLFEEPYVGQWFVTHSVIMIRFLTTVSTDDNSKI